MTKNIFQKFACFTIFSTAAGDVIGSSKFPADLAALCPIDSQTDRTTGGPKDGRSNTVTNCGRYRYLCFSPFPPREREFHSSKAARTAVGERFLSRVFREIGISSARTPFGVCLLNRGESIVSSSEGRMLIAERVEGQLKIFLLHAKHALHLLEESRMAVFVSLRSSKWRNDKTCAHMVSPINR